MMGVGRAQITLGGTTSGQVGLGAVTEPAE